MGIRARIFAGLASLPGLALLAVGIVYLTVACEKLPGFLGPTPGDTSPRVGLGVAGVLLGTVGLLAVLLVFRRARLGGD